ncbi:dihydrofolate reductase [Agromyces humi]|uniref:dihydrofolate reductase n=1 Tax=Agromyces humi TaxID=1766800 RepID=UPI0013590074|nr:dihydrofolate reductase [Agromyces humi]
MTAVGLIWAQSLDGVIGAAGGMPWHVPEDLAHFRDITSGAPVIMGRRTWESLPARFRPLPGRDNIVVTRQQGWASSGAAAARSLPEALALTSRADRAWVIGGGQLYKEAIPYADRLEVTTLGILTVAKGDTFAPPVDRTWRCSRQSPVHGWLISTTGVPYRFTSWTR